MQFLHIQLTPPACKTLALSIFLFCWCCCPLSARTTQTLCLLSFLWFSIFKSSPPIPWVVSLVKGVLIQGLCCNFCLFVFFYIILGAIKVNHFSPFSPPITVHRLRRITVTTWMNEWLPISNPVKNRSRICFSTRFLHQGLKKHQRSSWNWVLSLERVIKH